MNSHTADILKIAASAAVLIAWFIARPARCKHCNVRPPVASRYCQSCGSLNDREIPPAAPLPAGAARKPRTPARHAITYVLAMALSITVLSALPIGSGTKAGLGMCMVMGGLVWVLFALKRAATCRSCGTLTHGAYCSNCGSQQEA